MFEIKVKYFEDTLFTIHFKVQSPKVLTKLFFNVTSELKKVPYYLNVPYGIGFEPLLGDEPL